MTSRTDSRFPASNLLAQNFDRPRGRPNLDGATTADSLDIDKVSQDPKSDG